MTGECGKRRLMINAVGDAYSAEVLLRATGITKSFGGNSVLNDVALELRRGEVVLLRGDNGSGKTTLLNVLTGNLAPDAGLIEVLSSGAAERFLFPRPWYGHLNPFDHFTPERVASEAVGRTWQDVRLFGRQTLLDNVAVATPGQIGENPFWAMVRRGSVRREEGRNLREAHELLARIGLGDRVTSSADHISLGQSKRVAIARALRGGARILFLDEPLAGLDQEGTEGVLELLGLLVRDHRITLVVVEHLFHIPRILRMANTVWTLERGRLRADPVSQAQSAAGSSANDGVPAWATNIAGSGARISRHRIRGSATLTKLAPPTQECRPHVLEVDQLAVRRGSRLVIGQAGPDGPGGLSFHLSLGELALLQAPNGWGKTTLLEAIAGLMPADAGKIRLSGTAIESLSPWCRSRLGLSLCRANDRLFPHLTLKQFERLAGGDWDSSVPPHLRNRAIVTLSGGERQMASVSSCLHRSDATVMMLDEPFAALDATSIQHVVSLISAMLRKSAVLVASPSEHGSDSEISFERGSSI